MIIPCLRPQPSALSLPLRPTTAPLSPAFEHLFADLDGCESTPTVGEIARCLGAATLELADVLPHTASDRGTYVRTLVHASARYEALVMCWLPGQRSPVHDHGDSACGVRVIQGAATETLYTIGADGFADPMLRRVFYAGDVLGAAAGDVHSLGNLPVPGQERWEAALVTLHVYAPELGSSRKFLEREPLLGVAYVA
jgi:cysteine dioxygenase